MFLLLRNYIQTYPIFTGKIKNSRNYFLLTRLKCNNKFLPAQGSNIIRDAFLYAEFPKLTKPILKAICEDPTVAKKCAYNL